MTCSRPTSSHSESPLELPTFQGMSARDKYDVITMLVAPILLVVALSLTINYAVNPVAPMIQFTSNFSMSLPLIICSSAGLILSVMLLVQIVRRNQMREAFDHLFAGVIQSSGLLRGSVRTVLHPGGREEGVTVEKFEETNAALINYGEQVGSIVKFQTRDGVTLGGYWHFTHKDAPTAILFHGNAMTAERGVSYGEFYKNRGFNVLMLEYRGYGISGGIAAGENQELEAYFDAEAGLKFVLSQGVNKDTVLAHGYSLGGSYAAALGYFFGIKHVILDHTFTSFPAVFKHVGRVVTFGSAAKAIHAAYKEGAAKKDPNIPDAIDLKTDSFNSLAKVKKMKGEVLIIRGEADHLMPMEFGEEFIQTKYPRDLAAQKARLITVEGGHGNAGQLFKTPSAMVQLRTFLVERGLSSDLI